jgi:hypothetical protein
MCLESVKVGVTGWSVTTAVIPQPGSPAVGMLGNVGSAKWRSRPTLMGWSPNRSEFGASTHIRLMADALPAAILPLGGPGNWSRSCRLQSDSVTPSSLTAYHCSSITAGRWVAATASRRYPEDSRAPCSGILSGPGCLSLHGHERKLGRTGRIDNLPTIADIGVRSSPYLLTGRARQ